VKSNGFELRLRSHRESYGFSTDALAQISGLSRKRIDELERSSAAPTIYEAETLGRALATDARTLLDPQAPRIRSAA
jgi:transcriptional regulator with XRE-family HTH domain